MSAPAFPSNILFPEFPVIVLFKLFPVPLIADVPVRVRFSTFEESV